MKRKILAALILLTSAALASGFQTNTEWVRYTSVEGRYNLLLPQQPKLSTQEGASSTGEKLTQYMAQVGDAESLYFIGYFDYAPNMVFSLDKARDGMIEAIKGTLLKEEAISLGGSPGREVKISAKNGEIELLTRARFYEIGRRIYILQHIFLKANDSPTVAEKTARFFDSFKVTAAR